MKTLGIVGGIGPDSTIEYYKLIVAACRERGEDPRVIINSISVRKLLMLAGASRMAELTDFLVEALEKLASAGAEMGLLAANTPHVIFGALQRRSPVPLVGIVEAACAAVKATGIKRAGLFGTSFTMQGGFYPDVFVREGVTLIVPRDAEQEYIHSKYMSELVQGRFESGTRDGMLRIVDRMVAEECIEALVLAGTELPLLLRDPGGRSVVFVDTTRTHVEATLAIAFSP